MLNDKYSNFKQLHIDKTKVTTQHSSSYSRVSHKWLSVIYLKLRPKSSLKCEQTTLIPK